MQSSKDIHPQTITDPLSNHSCWKMLQTPSHSPRHIRHFHNCHMCSVWAPMVALLILAFSGKCQSCCMILDCEHRSLIPPSWSLFMTVWSVTCTPVACWRSFCRTLAVLLLFLLTHGSDTSPAAGLFFHLRPGPSLLV